MESMMIYVPIVMAVIGLLFMAMKRAWVLKQESLQRQAWSAF